MARLGDLLALVRWPGAVTAAGNAATGFLLAHDRTSPGGRAAAAGAVLGGFLVYAGGVVLNDVADVEKDSTEHPGRPIPSGRVPRRDAAWFGALLLVAGTAAVGLLANPAAGAIVAVAAVAAAAYDFVGRSSAAAGAALLGGARAANAAAGAAAAAGTWHLLSAQVPRLAPLHAVALFAYTALLTWISTFEGRRPSRVAAGSAAVALAVTASISWAFFDRTTWTESPGIPLLLLLATLVAAARESVDPDGIGLGALVRAGVFGFLLVDAAWLMGQGRYEGGFYAILVYVAVRLVLTRARS